MFTREETVLKAQALHSAGHDPEQIAALMNKEGYTNSHGRELQGYTIGYILKKGEEQDKQERRRIVSALPVPTVAADGEAEQARRRFTPRNPSEGKVLLAQQVLQTKDLPLMRRCIMAVDLLMS